MNVKKLMIYLQPGLTLTWNKLLDNKLNVQSIVLYVMYGKVNSIPREQWQKNTLKFLTHDGNFKF